MSSQGASPSTGNIADVVTEEKSDVLNTGVVDDSRSKSLSTLRAASSVAEEKPSVAFEAKNGKTSGAGRHRRSKAIGKPRASAATERSTESSSGKDANASDADGMRSQRQGFRSGAAAFGKEALREEALNQLDDSPELEGMSGMARRSWNLRRVAGKAYGAYKEKRAGAAQSVSESPKRKTRRAGASATKTKQGATSSAQSGLKGASRGFGAKAREASGKVLRTLGSAVAGAGVPIGGMLAGILAFVMAALVVGQIISAIFGFWENEEMKRSLEGLPPYITYEMVEEAVRCQEEYGHPAGCTIAQIIVESGQGDHLSRLATQDHNLFGMKWSSSFAAAPEVSGKSSWVTGEEYNGQSVTITALFTSFKSDVSCIRFRSRVFLQAGTYANNPAIREAIASKSSDRMAEGLKEAGWATSSSYVESLKGVMDAYGLRRFDGMSLEQLKASEANAQAIIAAAYSQLGVPYVWGGTTPGVGLDCSGLTQYCYRQAGISIPRQSEAQADAGIKVPLSQARPGDILWRTGHVAIYLGGDSYIHEPSSGNVCCIAQGISHFSAAVHFN